MLIDRLLAAITWPVSEVEDSFIDIVTGSDSSAFNYLYLYLYRETVVLS